MSEKVVGGEARGRRWLSGAEAGPYELRILSGAHAGARLKLSDGRYMVGDDLGADIFVTDMDGAAAPLRLENGRVGFGETSGPLAAIPCRLTVGPVNVLVRHSARSEGVSPKASIRCLPSPESAPASRPRAAAPAG